MLDAETPEAYLPLRVGWELRSAGGGVIGWSPEASQVDEAELRARIRELCSSGRMPRELPTSVPRKVGRAVTEPRVQIGLQAQEHCFICGEVGPVVSYTYPDGRVIRLHATCNILWHEECERA